MSDMQPLAEMQQQGMEFMQNSIRGGMESFFAIHTEMFDIEKTGHFRTDTLYYYISGDSMHKIRIKQVKDRSADSTEKLLIHLINVLFYPDLQELSQGELISVTKDNSVGAMQVDSKASANELRDIMEHLEIVFDPIIVDNENDIRYYRLISKKRYS